MTVKTTTRDQISAHTPSDSVQVVLPVSTNPKPIALIVHCADSRFRKAFRNFIEGDASIGCLGLKEDEYVNLVIPGGVGTMGDAMALPKQFKVTKEQIEFLLDHFPGIKTVILINHEDCAAYKFLREKIGAVFLRHFASLLERQSFDLIEVAKSVMHLEGVKANIKLYMAKFADAEHTKVRFEEVTVK